MKKQEATLLKSSSLRRDRVSTTKTIQQTTNVGCMSGIFNFVSKYHTRRKFLTLGKKQEHEATNKQIQISKSRRENHSRVSTKPTLEMPRSPVIPPEIRRQSISSSSSPKLDSRTTDMAEEKRRRLLGALEKCDEDLQTLKRVIMSVRGVQTPPLTPPCNVKGGDGKRTDEEEEEVGSEEPSPVSVLDCHQLLDRSPIVSCSIRTRQEKSMEHERQQMHQQQQVIIRQHSSTQRPNTSSSFMVPTSLQSLYVPTETRPHINVVATTISPPPSRWSSATRDTVIEVCKAVEFGQRREVGSVVFVLQGIIFRELVEEVVNEFGCLGDFCGYSRRLPYLACKRKLSL